MHGGEQQGLRSELLNMTHPSSRMPPHCFTALLLCSVLLDRREAGSAGLIFTLRKSLAHRHDKVSLSIHYMHLLTVAR